MATINENNPIKIAEYILNDNNGQSEYDLVYKETSSDLVKRTDKDTDKDTVEKTLQWTEDYGITKQNLYGNLANADTLDFKNISVQEILAKNIAATDISTDNFSAESAFIKSLKSEVGTFGYLKAGDIEADYLKTNNLSAELGKITTLESTSAFVQYLNSVAQANIDLGYVKDLIAGNIYSLVTDTGYLTIGSDDSGNIQINKSLMQFKDNDGNVYIQLGMDGSGKPSLIIKDGNKKTLFNGSGITENAITDGLIVDKMLKPTDASYNGISADRLNLDSVTKKVIDNDNFSISVAKVYYDEDKKSLNTLLSTMQTGIKDANDLASKISNDYVKSGDITLALTENNKLFYTKTDTYSKSETDGKLESYLKSDATFKDADNNIVAYATAISSTYDTAHKSEKTISEVIGDYKGNLTTLSTKATQTANTLSWIVNSDGQDVTNLSLTNKAIELISSNINLTADKITAVAGSINLSSFSGYTSLSNDVSSAKSDASSAKTNTIAKDEIWYLASASSTGITNATTGFTTTIQTISKEKPYLWCYHKYYNSSGTQVGNTTSATIIGRYGTDGANGKTPVKGVDYNDGYTPVKGVDYTDGTSSYTWIRYSKNSDGSGFVETPTSETKYIGVYTGTSSSAPTSNSSYKWSLYVGTDGYTPQKGVDYFDGVNGTNSYTWIRYATDDKGTGFTSTPSSSTKYVAMITTTTSTSPSASDFSGKWQKYIGENGQSIKGEDGKSAYLHIAYANNSTGTEGFSTTSGEGKLYIGQYTDNTEADSTVASKYTWTLIKGSKGDKGDSGNGINSITYYYKTTTTQTKPSANDITSTTIPTLSATDKYLWQKEVIDFTDSNVADKTEIILIAVYGDKGQKGDSMTIKSKAVEYQASTSGTTTPTGTWSTSIPTVANGSYLWTRVTVTYSDNTSVVSYSVAYKGTNGGKGDKGDPGTSAPVITKVETQYYISTSSTSATGGSWSTICSYSGTDIRYIWTKTVTYYDKGESSSSTPVYDASLSKAIIGSNQIFTSDFKMQDGFISMISPSIKIKADNITMGDSNNTSLFSISNGKVYASNLVIGSSNLDSTVSKTISDASTNASNAVSTANSSIAKDEIWYLASSQSTGITNATTGFTTDIQTISKDKPYLWCYHKYYNSSNTQIGKATTATIIGRYGIDGANGSDGNKVIYYGTRWWTQSQIDTYCKTDYSTSWTKNIDNLTVNKGDIFYLEINNTTKDKKGTLYLECTSNSSSSDSYAYGIVRSYIQDGNSITISSSTVTYVASSSQTTQPTSGWDTSIPTLTAVTPYLWTKTYIKYSDGKETNSYSVSSTLEGVNIGGRNLLYNTNNLTKWNIESGVNITKQDDEYFAIDDTQNRNSRWGIYLNSLLLSNDEYTLSYYAKGQHIIELCENGSFNGRKIIASKSPSEYEKIIVTFTITENSYRFYINTKDVFYIKDVKLEKGNKATDWSPAPEDITVKSTTTLYYSQNSTTAPSKPTSKVTSTSSSTGVWTTVQPSTTKGYTVFECVQTEMESGILSWGDVKKNNSLTMINAWANGADLTLIDGGSIKTGTITALGAVTAGTFSLGNGNFSVDKDGKLNCKNATISGAITSSDGKIGGFDIGSTKLYQGLSVSPISGFDATKSGILLDSEKGHECVTISNGQDFTYITGEKLLSCHVGDGDSGDLYVTKTYIDNTYNNWSIGQSISNYNSVNTNIAEFSINCLGGITSENSLSGSKVECFWNFTTGELTTKKLTAKNVGVLGSTVTLSTPTSLASSTNTNLGSFSLTAGTWLVLVYAELPETTTSRTNRNRNVWVSASSKGNTISDMTKVRKVPSQTSGATMVTFPVLLSPTSTTTYYVVANSYPELSGSFVCKVQKVQLS